MNHAWLSVAAFFVLAPAARSTQSQVWVVDPSGHGHVTNIQDAIYLAADHDVILMRGGVGAYGGLTIDGKSLRIIADVGASVEVRNATVRNVPWDGAVLLGGIKFEGYSSSPTQHPPGLLLANNSGHVRLEDCTITGSGGWSTIWCGEGDASDGVHVLDSSRVAFASCTIEGGFGGNNWFHACTPEGLGGDGGEMQNSSVALYECLVYGGEGGWASDDYSYGRGGRGGQAWRVLDNQLFASRSFFTGGTGGSAWSGGYGGDGLEVLPGARAVLRSSPRLAGLGGNPSGPNGHPQVGGGAFKVLTLPVNQSRVFYAPLLVADSGTMKVDVYGRPGDRVEVRWSLRPEYQFSESLAGVLLNRPPPPGVGSSGTTTMPAAGYIQLELPVPDLTPSVPVRSYYLQGLVVDTQGNTTLGSPMHPTVVDCDSLTPDCNGNGQFDSCDLLSGFSQDCNLNSIPDECEVDCNGNGIPDTCDLADETSEDFNENGIPDECEANRRWYVDDSAVAGGDGSASSPFQTIAQGLAAPSISGDIILVNDGLYTGPGNRGLYWGEKDLVITSANGPGACIIDCQLAGYFLSIDQDVSAAARLEGFTIRNGWTNFNGGGVSVYGDPTIANCVFEGCRAEFSQTYSGWGGGLSLGASGSEVRDCVFRNNRAAKGGGLAYQGIGQPRIHHCLFEDNVSTETGGGLYVNKLGNQSILAQISYCKILGNRSEGIAGGAFFGGGRIEQCLIAGNEALTGSALVCVGGRRAEVVGSTLAANLASVSSVFVVQPSGDLVLTNAMVWGNSSLDGRLATLQASGSKLTASYDDLQGGQGAIFVESGTTLTWGPGNIGANPFFVDPDGSDNDPLTLGDNDYRPGMGALCLDAGNNLSVSPDTLDFDGDGNTLEALPFDLNGNARFIDLPAAPDTGSGIPPIVDMGCYERQP